VAGGRAFTFRYAETTELLEAAGAEVVEVDPLRDEALPEATSGLYLGGGFPEMHAPELGANAALRHHVGTAVARGLPTVAECAGLLYLCRSVRGPEGPAVPMVGAIGVDAVMGRRLTLAYRTMTAPEDNVLARAGQVVTGHEFHRTVLTGAPVAAGSDHAPAWLAPAPSGVASATLHASYLHTHWAGTPVLARRFALAAARWQSSSAPAVPPLPVVGAPR
jgi:cobyrinic acid a,c-diamide synthase